jgi:HK97 family phage major capsid protein
MRFKHSRFTLAAAAAMLSSAGGSVIERKEAGGGDTQPTILEVKGIIEGIGRAFEEFKRTNDERIKAIAAGKSGSDFEAKLAKIEKELTDLGEAKAEIDKIMAKLQRPGAGAGSDAGIEAECKSFNEQRRAVLGQAGALPTADVTVDQYKAYKSGFFKLLRKGNLELLDDGERKAMSVGSDSDGGYMVPAPTTGRIVQRIYELSPIRQIANVVSISTGELEGIADTGEADAGWVAEMGTRSDTSTPAVQKYKISAEEMYAQPKVTQKLLDDAAVDIEGWLAMKVADKFARKEGNAFCVGDGVGKPRGFAAYTTAATGDDTRTWGELEHVVTGASGAFAASNPADVLFDLIGKFRPAYLQNASWVTRREVITLIRKFKEATTNAYLWQPSLQAGQPDRLLGYPIVTAQDLSAVGANSLSTWLGDFREGYQIVDRIGVRVLRDPFTAKPYVRFYTTKRVGGGVVNFEAIKALKFSA